MHLLYIAAEFLLNADVLKTKQITSREAKSSQSFAELIIKH